MSHRLDHIGVAVSDIDRAREAYGRVLGLDPSDIEEIPGKGVRVCFFQLENCRIELITPIASATPGTEANAEANAETNSLSRFLKKQGEGLHHVSLEPSGRDLRALRRHLVNSGVDVIGDDISEGSEGSEVFFVHPRALCGALFEFGRPEFGRPGEEDVS